MKSWQMVVALVVVAAAGAGCIQDQKILKLKKDGSGSLNIENVSPGNVDVILDVNGYFR